MVDDAHNEEEWHEWFAAGGWIHRTLPSLAVPGNHEYRPLYQKDIPLRKKTLSIQWNHQFTLPNNGINDILETNYFLDYQGVRFIALNSNVKIEEQMEWLENVLKNNPHKWTIALTLGCNMHGKFYVYFYGIIGITILMLASIFGHDFLGETGEIIFTLIGTSIISFGHFKNQKLCEECCN